MRVSTVFPLFLSISIWGSHVLALPAPQQQQDDESTGSSSIARFTTESLRPVPSSTLDSSPSPGSTVDASPSPTTTSTVEMEEHVQEGGLAGQPEPDVTPVILEAPSSTDPVPVETITSADSKVQIPEAPTATPDVRVLGFVNTELDTRGNPNVEPFPTEDPRTQGKFDSSATRVAPAVTYTRPATIVAPVAPVAKREAEADHMNFLPVRQTVTNIFGPIATTAPPALFSRRTNHPIPLPPMSDGSTGPVQTNKFFANMMLGGRNNPVFTYPYEVWWSNQLDAPWGLGIDHREPEQRQFGPTEAPSGAVRWYASPIWIRSIQLGATEFNHQSSSMEMANLKTQSADLTFFADSSVSRTTAKMEVTLCQGMGFISSTVTNLTPVLDTAVWVRTLTKVENYRLDATKYLITLENDSVWALYAFSSSLLPTLTPLDLVVINNGHIEASGKFSGLIQIVKLSKTTTVDPAVETAYDNAAGSYCKSVDLAGSVAGSTGSYQFNYQRQGPGTSELLMFALPHHVKSFESTTTAKLVSAVKLQSPAKGVMTAVVSDQWRLREVGIPNTIGWLPVRTGGAATWSAANLNRLSTVAKSELTQDFANVTNLDTMYFAGKPMAKYAFMCLTMSEILKDVPLTRQCQIKLKAAFARFANNTQINKLVYDTKWKGVVTDAIYKTGDPQVEFGAGVYNDHHFHYGYFIQAAAIIAYLENKHFDLKNHNWIRLNGPWVNTLIRDVANPSSLDPHFPVSRSFDWFHGHSWAKGLFESWDGKDEESSSEDYNFAYAMKLWGNVVGDAAMEARGNLMLAIMKNSMNEYMLLSSGNTNHPANFVGNKLSGILFENKVEHTTYFGHLPQYIHGVHMLPLTAISPYIRGQTFVTEEWNLYFRGKTGAIDDGWKGILYANLALIDAKGTFAFFNSTGWKAKWLDGGASRSWYMAFSGSLGGAA
ncbi:endo-1,3(4)-beta-glucanase [Tricharina praecox]|uniref:endo-1,3(4)-beta-glucanase n=1 Tax=Tricharina praecox TaxID=43433 RepID=UPI0022210721|nr:endo-1,3(4)-beta-glucanase [Tricharina praecox]KAI5845975.1 endo-1,3(4)-beta-glucanase [Tricharina praecox]